MPATLAQLQALELRSEAAAAKRNLHDNDETASEDIKVVTLLEFWGFLRVLNAEHFHTCCTVRVIGSI